MEVMNEYKSFYTKKDYIRCFWYNVNKKLKDIKIYTSKRTRRRKSKKIYKYVKRRRK